MTLFVGKEAAMLFTICEYIALVILLASIFTCISISRRKRQKRPVKGAPDRNPIKPIHALIFGFVLSVFCLNLPIVEQVTEPEKAGAAIGTLSRVILAIHGTFQVFTVDVSAPDTLKAIQEIKPGLSIYYLMMCLLIVLCPFLTMSFILSFFKNVNDFFRILFGFGKDRYVFSELNEKSIALAESIADNHKDEALIIFTDVFETEEECGYELRADAQEIGAVCIKKDIAKIGRYPQKRKAALFLFAIGKNEAENVSQTVLLASEFKDRPNTELYVFSTRTDGELILTKLNKYNNSNLTIRRVNDTRSLVIRHLDENGKHLLFDSAKPCGDGDRQISAVIVGLGGHGTEMLKAMSWYCQMDDYYLSIDAFDIDEHADRRFAAIAPELMSDRINGKIYHGEARYSIKIHPSCDVNTLDFHEEIEKLKDTTYVFVALGDDTLNIATAEKLRMLFERINRRPMPTGDNPSSKAKPIIQAIVYNPEIRDALKGVRNVKEQTYDIDFIGTLNETCSEKVIINSELEQRAFAVHRSYYRKEDNVPFAQQEHEFYDFEYNYNSSVASAVHRRLKEELGRLPRDKALSDYTAEELDIENNLEHRRWNAYMRAEGYVYSGSKEKSSRNDMAKMHHNLVVYDELSEEDIAKDARVIFGS